MQRIETDDGGQLVRAYNWSVIIPLLAHFYPGMFSGMRTVRKSLDQMLSSSLRCERWLEANTLVALGRKGDAIALMEQLRQEREGADSNIEMDAPLELDVLDITPDQLRMYIDGITELMKLNPMVDQKKVSRPKLFEVYWEQDWHSILAEARRHGLACPSHN